MKRKELAPTQSKVIYHKTEDFGKLLWELSLATIEAKVKSLKNSTSPPHSNFIEGLSQVIPALTTFLDTSSQDSKSDNFEDLIIKVYDMVHLGSGEILRTSGDFQGKEWFSNVAVLPAEDQDHYKSDEGAWYGKVMKFSNISKCFASLSLTNFKMCPYFRKRVLITFENAFLLLSKTRPFLKGVTAAETFSRASEESI